MPRLSRRAVLTAGVAAATGAALGMAGDAVGAGGARPRRGSAEAPPVHVHVTAHPDDDLYFFNPDLWQSLRAGAGVVGVCVTAGEADGRNYPVGDPLIAAVPINYEDYAAARQHGLRAAYARMAVGDPAAAWRRELVVTRAGAPAELATLVAVPRIRLVFLNLWDDGGKDPGARRGRLRTLWSGLDATQPTMRPTGSPVPAGFAHTRSTLLDALVELLELYRPAVVRTMDPDPDHERHDAANPQASDSGEFSDHEDHTAVALFTWAALRQYWRGATGGTASIAAGTGGTAAVESYRGYYNQRWPQNLDRAAYAQKLSLLATYGWADHRPCGEPAGCGDLKLGERAASREYGRSTTLRYGAGATWLHADADGRLAAFAVLGGRLVGWVEQTPGGDRWRGPEIVGGEGLLPYLAVIRNAAGGLQVFAVRMVPDADPARQLREVVTAGQPGPGARFGDWVSLGNPHQGDVDPVRRRGLGMPVPARHDDGRLQVFARTFDGGVSARVQAADGAWQPWAALAGTGTQDGLSAITTSGGRVELYASTKTGVLRWYRDPAAGAGWACAQLAVPAPAGPPAVVEQTDGRLALLVREAATAAVLAYEQDRPGGRYRATPARLGGPGGFGPVAAAAVGAFGGHLALATRSGAGTVGVSWRRVGDLGAGGGWLRTGPRLLHAPAVGTDARGRAVVAALGIDGRLHVARQTPAEASQRRPAWSVAAA